MRVARLLGCCLWAWVAIGWAADGAAGRNLPPSHAKAGVTCFDCHQAEKPTVAASSGPCMDCHGDAPAVAELTKKLPVNPHVTPKAPHPGPFTCTDCHHQHRPAAVKCLECHPTFKFGAA